MSNEINLNEIFEIAAEHGIPDSVATDWQSISKYASPEYLKKKSDIHISPKVVEMLEVGYVKSISEGISIVLGLYGVSLHEMVYFENNVKGIVRQLDRFSVKVVMFENYEKVTAGSVVKRAHRLMHIPVSKKILGRVVNVFGEPIDGNGEISFEKEMQVEYVPAPSMISRSPVSRPISTGLVAIDSMIPIGMGQREMILGDARTGKTSIAINTIINQKRNKTPVYCVYVAIGQNQASVASVVERLKKADAMKYTVVVCAFSSDSAHSQFIAPYSGCAIAEFFMQKGFDSLVVYDDLSSHAIANRQIGRLLGSPSGRDAHPPDAFYIHSRLLERAASTENGSITAIPILKSVSSELDYILTNVISITDGQIFLSTEKMHTMPAINIGLSVSRVGSAAQTKMMSTVAKSMKLDLSSYQDTVDFQSLAGDELDKSQLSIIQKGEQKMHLIKQDLDELYTIPEQVALIVGSDNGLFMNCTNARHRKERFLSLIKTKCPQVITKDHNISDQEMEQLKSLANFVGAEK